MPATPLLPVSMLDLQSLASADSLDRIYVWDASETKLKSMLVSSIVGAAQRIVAPTAISADQNNYDPTGLSTADVLYLSTGGGIYRLTGIAGGVDGRRLSLIGDGNGAVVLCPEDSSSTAANRFRVGWSAGPIFLFEGQIDLVYSGALSRWLVANHYNPPGAAVLQFNFDAADMSFATSVNGASAAATPLLTSGSPYMDLATGTSSTGRAGFSTSSVDRLTAGGYGVLWGGWHGVSALSDGSNRYTARWGFLDSLTGEPTDGIYFRYTDNVNSGRIQAVCRNNGTETAVDTGLAADHLSTEYGSWCIAFNDDDWADFYQFTSANKLHRVASIATNLPGSGRTFGIGASIIKSVGATSRTLWIGAMRFHLED